MAEYRRFESGQIPVGFLGDFDRVAWGHCGREGGLQHLFPVKMNITSAQDPPYFPGPFSIDGQGQLWAPSQGLKGQAQKVSTAGDLVISMN